MMIINLILPVVWDLSAVNYNMINKRKDVYNRWLGNVHYDEFKCFPHFEEPINSLCENLWTGEKSLVTFFRDEKPI